MTSSITGFLTTQGTPTSTLSPTATTSSSSASSGTSADVSSGASSLNSDYNSFLTLLTTQLKNQDPSQPEDPNQFTSELVQLNGVQQQLLSNQLLQQLVNASPASGVSSAVSLIGKSITATSATSNLANGQASWNYSLPETASNASVSISNSTGQVVYTGTAPSFAAGSNAFNWNGQSNSGVQQPAGAYTLSVAATDSNGGAITPTLSVSGVASSVQSVAGVTSVTVGATQVPVSSITNVSGGS